MRHGDLIRLARILGMLGSDHAGERASAALAAHRLVKACGTTWWTLLAPPIGANRPVPPSRFVEVLHDPVSAAESRMRQLRQENLALRAEVARLKRWLGGRHATTRWGRARRG